MPVKRLCYARGVRVRVEAGEVQTLKANGRPWDGPGGARVPQGELARFFALDLNGQLERLVATGDAPNPPDVLVRLLVDGRAVLETYPVESFDPSWPDGPEVDLVAGAAVTVEVYDRDLVLHDLIGKLDATVPARPADGRWRLPPFGQVRHLTLRID